MHRYRRRAQSKHDEWGHPSKQKTRHLFPSTFHFPCANHAAPLLLLMRNWGRRELKMHHPISKTTQSTEEEEVSAKQAGLPSFPFGQTLDRPVPTARAHLFLPHSLLLQPPRDVGRLVGRRFFIFLRLPPRQDLIRFDREK